MFSFKINFAIKADLPVVFWFYKRERAYGVI